MVAVTYIFRGDAEAMTVSSAPAWRTPPPHHSPWPYPSQLVHGRSKDLPRSTSCGSFRAEVGDPASPCRGGLPGRWRKTTVLGGPGGGRASRKGSTMRHRPHCRPYSEKCWRCAIQMVLVG